MPAGQKPQPQLDQQSTRELNLTVLQRIDPAVEEILTTAGHVTLYEFDVDQKAWSRKDVEGSLFVVKRRAQPRFQFIVMNRRSTENLVEDLLGDFEFEIQMPYLLYRNAAQEVNGIWFYNQRECDDVTKLFTRILNAFSKAPPKHKVLPPSGTEFEALEAVPTAATVEGPLEGPASSSSGSAAAAAAAISSSPIAPVEDAASTISRFFGNAFKLGASQQQQQQEAATAPAAATAAPPPQNTPASSSSTSIHALLTHAMAHPSPSSSSIISNPATPSSGLSSLPPPLPMPMPSIASITLEEAYSATSSSLHPSSLPPHHVIHSTLHLPQQQQPSQLQQQQQQQVKPSFFMPPLLPPMHHHHQPPSPSAQLPTASPAPPPAAAQQQQPLGSSPVTGGESTGSAVPDFHGSPFLQPFPPPAPPLSFAPSPSAAQSRESVAPPGQEVVLTKDGIRDALLALVADDRFVDMVYRRVLAAHSL